MEKNKKKTTLIIAISVILIILIASGVFAYVYFTTDLLKGNQELFFKYLAKNGETFDTLTKNSKNELMEKILQDKYTTNSKVTFNIESNDTQIASQNIPIGNFSIEYNAKTDKPNNNKSSQTTLKYLTNDLFTLKYIQNKDLYALKSDEVINKYLALDNNNLKEFAKKFGITDTTNIPNKIESINLEQLFYISEEDKNAIMAKCIQIINEEISKDKYTKQNNVTIKVEDKDITTTAYSLEVTPQELNNIVIKMLTALKEDNNILSFFIEKMKLIDSTTTITIKDLQDAITELIDSMSSLEEIQGESLKITVYVNNNQLIRTEIGNENNKIYIDIEKNDNSERMIISFDNQYNNSAIEGDTNNQNTYNNNSQMQTMLDNASEFIETENYISGYVSGILTLNKIELAKQIQGTEETEIAVLTFGGMKVSVQSKVNVNENIKKDTIINVNVADTIYFTTKVNTTITPSTNIEIEQLTKENSATINDFSAQYILNLSQSIVNRLQTIFTNKLEFITKLQLESNTDNNQIDNILEPNDNNTTNNTITSNTII